MYLFTGVITNFLSWRFFTVTRKLSLPATMFMGAAIVGHLYSRVQIFYVYDSEMVHISCYNLIYII